MKYVLEFFNDDYEWEEYGEFPDEKEARLAREFAFVEESSKGKFYTYRIQFGNEIIELY